jgi:hypothetical protein
MMKDLFSRRSVTLSGSLAALISGVLVTPASAATTQLALTQSSQLDCSPPPLSQPFLFAGDANWYTLAAGQTVDDFNAAGWTLTGGAKIVWTRLADGKTGRVLDLPSGAKAVSPTMCVNYGYQLARTYVRDIAGTRGVQVTAAYDGGGATEGAEVGGQVVGQGTGWTLSSAFNVLPSDRWGWQRVSFTFSAGGSGGEYQLSNFWVDPRHMG